MREVSLRMTDIQSEVVFIPSVVTHVAGRLGGKLADWLILHNTTQKMLPLRLHNTFPRPVSVTQERQDTHTHHMSLETNTQHKTIFLTFTMRDLIYQQGDEREREREREREYIYFTYYCLLPPAFNPNVRISRKTEGRSDVKEERKEER